MKIEKELTGERIVIRNYAKDDLEFCTTMWFDKENGKFLSDPEKEYVDAVYQKALDGLSESTVGYYLIIQAGKTDELLGTCCMFPNEERSIYDIGYCIRKKFWQQGYGTEAINLLVGWLRQQGAKKVTAEVAVENTASNALLKKCGFEVEREAEFRKYHMDVVYKSYIYQLLL